MSRRVERRGHAVETELDELQAWEELRFLVKHGILDSEFARSLAGVNFGSLSDCQADWCAILVEEHRAQKAAEVAAPKVESALRAIVAMVERARARDIKWPKIRLRDGTRLSLCGSQSRFAGQVKVTAPDGSWLGRIDQAGRFFGPTSVLPTLDEFASDPTSTARAYGRRTGNCCFCGKELSTRESLAVGYGPVCADHFGLPWGEAEESDEARLARLRAEIAQIDDQLAG